uniref:hypothetical protein n=1 Tax=Escherichia coli TaxID=562 RepID=UPI00200D3FCC
NHELGHFFQFLAYWNLSGWFMPPTKFRFTEFQKQLSALSWALGAVENPGFGMSSFGSSLTAGLMGQAGC